MGLRGLLGQEILSCYDKQRDDFYGPEIPVSEGIKNLAYVGITRARYRLVIPYLNRNDLINRLLDCIGSHY